MAQKTARLAFFPASLVHSLIEIIVVPNERTSGSVRVNISQVKETGRKMEDRGQG